MLDDEAIEAAMEAAAAALAADSAGVSKFAKTFFSWGSSASTVEHP
jgi:hypothetical protein